MASLRRHVLVWIAAVGAVALGTPHAFAQLPLPTPTVPTLPLPLPTLPSEPLPPLPPPPPPPPPPTLPAPTVPSLPSAPGAQPTAPSPSSPASSARPSPRTYAPPAASGRGLSPARRVSTRRWVSVRGRPIVLKFRGERSGPLRIEIVQVAPLCRFVGAMRVRGQRGATLVGFSGRVRGRVLPAGTYVLRTDLDRVRVVVTDRNARPSGLATRLRADSCGAGGVLGAGANMTASPTANERRDAKASVSEAATAAARAPAPRYADDGVRPRVLGVTISEVAEAASSLHPAFYVLLALAVIVLGIASVPATIVPHHAAAAVLAERRIELTLAGIAALVVAVAAYLLALR